MEKLNQILNAHVADGQDTKNKLLGAGFVVVKADGRKVPFSPKKKKIK